MMRYPPYYAYAPLPQVGERCGQKRSMWRDDVVVAVGTTRAAAEAAARLIGDVTEIHEVSALPPHIPDNCYCGDDD